ncbi:MAG: glycosyltransferase family 39 protein [Chloroflexota bacterium]
MGSFIKDRDAFFLLIVVLAGLATGQWLLTQTLTNTPEGNPPWTAVIAIFIAVLALLFNQMSATENTDASVENDTHPDPQPTHTQNVPANDDKRELESSATEEKTAVSPTPKPTALNLQSLPSRLDNKRIGLFLLAGLFLFYTLRTIPQLELTDSYLVVTMSWVVAILLCLTAVLPWQRPTLPALPRSKWYLLALIGLLLVTFLLRVWRVGTLPYTLSGDEASQGLEAIRVLNRDLRNPLATGWLGVPSMSFFFNSTTIWLFGRTVFGLRLAWVLIGTMNVMVTFWLVKRLQGEKMAWLTAVLLATYHYHIHYSRLGSNQIADPLFLSLALWFLYRAIDNGRRRDWALIGIVSGLAFYFYAGARLTPVIVIATIGYLFILNPRAFWQKHQAGLVVMVIVFLFVAAPMIQYANRFPGEFNARINQVGIIQSGWLEREVEIRDENTLTILWDQFQRAALAFTYYPDRTVWYGLREPLLNPLFSTLFLCGLLYGTLQLLGKETGQRLAPMVAWWWGGMLLGGMLTESPPSSQRLITLSVPVCFFLALALWELTKLAQEAIKGVPFNAVLAVGAVAFGYYSLSTYFVDYTPQRIYGGQHAELATQVAPTLNGLKADNRIYFVGAPWMYWDFATLPYLVADADAYNIGEQPETAPTTPDAIANGKGAVYLFLPERLEELEQVRQAFPQGTIEEVVSPINGRIMATLYKVPPLE